MTAACLSIVIVTNIPLVHMPVHLKTSSLQILSNPCIMASVIDKWKGNLVNCVCFERESAKPNERLGQYSESTIHLALFSSSDNSLLVRLCFWTKLIEWQKTVTLHASIIIWEYAYLPKISIDLFCLFNFCPDSFFPFKSSFTSIGRILNYGSSDFYPTRFKLINVSVWVKMSF